MDKDESFKVIPDSPNDKGVSSVNVTITPFESLIVIVDFWEDQGASFSISGKFNRKIYDIVYVEEKKIVYDTPTDGAWTGCIIGGLVAGIIVGFLISKCTFLKK